MAPDTANAAPQSAQDFARIEKALAYIRENFRDQPELDEIADAVALSLFHFQRLFTRWAGVSPKKFAQFLSLSHAKTQLRQGGSVLDAAHAAGLSGGGRLHDLFVSIEAMTPGAYKRGGAGLCGHRRRVGGRRHRQPADHDGLPPRSCSPLHGVASFAGSGLSIRNSPALNR